MNENIQITEKDFQDLILGIDKKYYRFVSLFIHEEKDDEGIIKEKSIINIFLERIGNFIRLNVLSDGEIIPMSIYAYTTKDNSFKIHYQKNMVSLTYFYNILKKKLESANINDDSAMLINTLLSQLSKEKPSDKIEFKMKTSFDDYGDIEVSKEFNGDTHIFYFIKTENDMEIKIMLDIEKLDIKYEIKNDSRDIEPNKLKRNMFELLLEIEYYKKYSLNNSLIMDIETIFANLDYKFHLAKKLKNKNVEFIPKCQIINFVGNPIMYELKSYKDYDVIEIGNIKIIDGDTIDSDFITYLIIKKDRLELISRISSTDITISDQDDLSDIPNDILKKMYGNLTLIDLIIPEASNKNKYYNNELHDYDKILFSVIDSIVSINNMIDTLSFIYKNSKNIKKDNINIKFNKIDNDLYLVYENIIDGRNIKMVINRPEGRLTFEFYINGFKLMNFDIDDNNIYGIDFGLIILPESINDILVTCFNDLQIMKRDLDEQ